MDQQLLVFVTVVERENFSRAAEELLMTQPAVSQYIRTLEDNYGARLLERTSKYVRLTKPGEIVYHHAKEIIASYRRMDRLIGDLINHASGPLSIGASFTFGEYVLPYIIAKMQKTHPAILPTVTIGNTKDIANYMVEHQLDIGIIEGHSEKDLQMHIEDFAEDFMVIVASPQYQIVSEKKRLTVMDLAEERWILREKGSGTREASDKVFEENGVEPDFTMTFGSTQAIKEALRAGLGISLLSRWAIQTELDNGDLCLIEVAGLPFTRMFSIVTTSEFQTKAQQVFIELLQSSEEITDLNFK